MKKIEQLKPSGEVIREAPKEPKGDSLTEVDTATIGKFENTFKELSKVKTK